MKRLLLGVVFALAALALFATPALAGDGSTSPEQVPANVYFEDGDCDSLPTIDVESQEGVVYTPRGAVTDSLVMRGKSGTVRWVRARHTFDKLMEFSSIPFK
jgi:hypothetical protein